MEIGPGLFVVVVHAVQPPTDHAPEQVLADSEDGCFLALVGLGLRGAHEQFALVERDELVVMAHPGEGD